MRIGTLFRFAILCIIAIYMMLPFVWQVLTSFKPLHEVDGPIWPETWLPGNFGQVFERIPFGRSRTRACEPCPSA